MTELPAGWEVRTLDDAGGLSARRPPPFEGTRPYLATADAVNDRLQPTTEVSFAGRPARADLLLKTGDVVQAKMRETDKAFRVTPAQDGWLASTGFAQFRPETVGTNPGFLLHHLRSEPFLRERDRLAVGSTQQAISDGELARIVVSLPPPLEQQRIADILDSADAEIQFASQTLSKIARIKRGLLDDLLNRGINRETRQLRDPSQNTREFERTKLGSYPAAWTSNSLDDSCELIVDCPHTTPEFRGYGVLVARTSSIRNGRFLIRTASRVSEAEYRQRIARATPCAGDIIFTREAPVGEAFVVPEGMRICLGQRVMLLRPDPEILDSNYLLSLIYAGFVKQRIDLLTAGTTNPHLNVGDVKKLEIPLPPIAEQRAITAAIAALDARTEIEARRRNKLRLVKRALEADLLAGRVRPRLEGAA